MDSVPDLEPGVPTTLAPGPDRPPSVSVTRALSFALDSPGVRRDLLVASLWLLVPVAGWIAVFGWSCEALHRLDQRNPAPIPRLRLRDFRHYLARGGAAWLIEQVGVGFLALATFALVAIVNATAIAAWIAAATPLVPILVLAFALTVALAAVGVFTALVNAMLTRAERSEELAEAVPLGPAWQLARRGFRRTLAAYARFAPAALALAFAGAAICGLGLLPAYVAIRLAAVHLRWQLLCLTAERGFKELPAKAASLLPSERHLAALPPISREKEAVR